MKSLRDEINVDGEPMRLYVSHPEGPGPFPAVVVMHHQGGVDPFVQEMTRLAKPQMWDFPM